jgi:hypothetical protein
MIVVRIEYGGMRAERSASDFTGAQAQLADMFARHGITASTRDPMRGRANATGARVRAMFITRPSDDSHTAHPAPARPSLQRTQQHDWTR